MTPGEVSSYLPYHEPDIITILTQSGFLLVLNIINHIFDNLIFCGLIGQIFIGIAWGTPGGSLLDKEAERVIVQFGYLGLILLVYEGGLQTKISALKANAVLSIAVALTGIVFPIALSFSLLSLASATPLQAFAAGAALCSTSLGTTFTILSTSGLTATRLGVVLSSGAMLDDVVGLVMVQVISNLGSNDFTPTTVVRPIAVSMGLAVVVVLVCILIAKPLTTWFNHIDGGKRGGLLTKVLGGTYTPVIIHTMLLLGLVTGATYAGTSNLFAAYLAGASISWWDSEYLEATLPNSTASTNKRSASQTQSLDEPPAIAASSEAVDEIHSTSNLNISRTDPPKSGVNTFEQFYGPVLHRVLKPLFFASIGLAIPITELFSGPIVWRGIIYTILMLFGKLVTGFWLVRFSGPIFPTFSFWSNIKDKVTTRKAAKSKKGKMKYQKEEATTTGQTEGLRPNDNIQLQDISQPTPDRPNIPQPSTRANEGRKRAGKVKCINPPLSLYPAAMLGTAMTARGEIGFLIASLAETTGVFSSATPSTTSESSEIYLITTWAILLCTIIGPLSVGTLVKRVRRLENNLAAKGDNEREQGPLGIWGVC